MIEMFRVISLYHTCDKEANLKKIKLCLTVKPMNINVLFIHALTKYFFIYSGSGF